MTFLSGLCVEKFGKSTTSFSETWLKVGATCRKYLSLQSLHYDLPKFCKTIHKLKKKIRFAVIFWENPLLFSNWNPGACYLDLLMTCVNILQYICINSAIVLVLGIILNKISKHHGGLVFMNEMFLWWYPFLWQTPKCLLLVLRKKETYLCDFW